jgi:hypothetical protein
MRLIGSLRFIIGVNLMGIRWLIEWWAGFSPWLRFGVAGFFLLISAILLLFGIFWVLGWVIGGVLLVFAFPSQAERRGYHDF